MPSTAEIPECLNSFEPVARLYLDNGSLDNATEYNKRFRLYPTLAGYALSPGRSYRAVVKVTGMANDQWKLKRGPRPYMVDDFEDGGPGPAGDERYITFDADKSAGNWWYSLVRYGDDLRLRIEFETQEHPPRELRIPVTLKFPKLVWFVAAFVSLSPALTSLLSEDFAHRIRGLIGFELAPWFRTYFLPTLFVLFVVWKWAAMPWIRAREVFVQTRRRLLQIPEQSVGLGDVQTSRK